MCLPPYIVFCALNANVFANGSLTSALIANIMLLTSYHYFIAVQGGPGLTRIRSATAGPPRRVN
jgi:hypothetical protein